jgi:hypothetical protein
MFSEIFEFFSEFFLIFSEIFLQTLLILTILEKIRIQKEFKFNLHQLYLQEHFFCVFS